MVYSALERHEAYAEQFVWATAITLRASALVLVSQRQTSSRVCQTCDFTDRLTPVG